MSQATSREPAAGAEGGPLRVEQRGRCRWLIIDRPRARNTLSLATLRALRAAVAAAAGEGELRSLVLTGAGGCFCAGADLKERLAMGEAETRAFLGELRAALDAVASFPRLTVAALGGDALGGGLELALCCDLRLAVEGAVLGLPEVRLGILPGGGGTQRLPRLIGLARAKEMVLLGRRPSASEALRIGLVHRVVPAGELATAVAELLAESEGCAPLAQALAKSALERSLELPLSAGLDFERACYEQTLTTEDRQEGLRAFVEKRPPIFGGR